MQQYTAISIDQGCGNDVQEGSGGRVFRDHHNNLLTASALHFSVVAARGEVSVRRIIPNFLRSAVMVSQRGATAVEYGLICAMIVLGMLVALDNVAVKTSAMWNNVANEVNNH